MKFTFHIMLNAAHIVLKVHYKNMKRDVSFLLGSITTIFRWCGHFFILPLYNSAKII